MGRRRSSFPDASMQPRTTLLFIVMIGATAVGVSLLGGPSIAVQIFVTVAFALMGLLTVLLVRRNLLPALTDRTRLWGRDTFRQLRRLTSSIVQGPSTPFPELAGPIEVYETPEDARGVRADQSEVARRLVERLAPRVPEDARGQKRNEFLGRLIREGEDLQSLSRLLKIDLAVYERLVSEALGAARVNRFAESILNLQLANERLRSLVESAFARHLSTLVAARARKRE
jgi:hypothetical protein